MQEQQTQHPNITMMYKKHKDPTCKLQLSNCVYFNAQYSPQSPRTSKCLFVSVLQ